MTEKQRKDRQKRNAQLEVKAIGPHTYLVQSQNDPSMYHKVILNGTPSCSCQDWRSHHEADPAWACKHLLAARDLAGQMGRVEARQDKSNGNGRSRFTPEEKAQIQTDIDALFGARPSAPKVNPQPPVPQFQEELTPCSECGHLLPAAQMIPWSAPGGSGYLCEECHQAHKEIQAELKAEAGEKSPSQEPDALHVQEETPAEPGIVSAEHQPQPVAHCALCGGEFPLAGDLSLSCKSCEYRLKAQERTSSPRRDALPEPQDNHGPTAPPSGIPQASRTCPGPDPGTLTLARAYPALTRPFPVNQVEVKPGSLNQEKTRALALPYVDMRACQARLDEVVGPDGWSVRYRALGVSAVICRLTVLEISREDVGETDPEACPGPRSGNANAWTSAVAQSFKRACASFGLGRYLYSLPRL